MNRKHIAGLFLFFFIFTAQIFSEELVGVCNLFLGESTDIIETKLEQDEWKKMDLFKNVIEYTNEKAELYNYPISCIDLKYNHDKLALITMYFNVENDDYKFSLATEKLIASYGFKFQSETGKHEDKSYKKTLTSGRKMLVISDADVTGVNNQISIMDLDLLLN